MTPAPLDARRLAAAYAGSRVLVLGGLGFIGTHVARSLAEAGARTTVVGRELLSHAGQVDSLRALGICVEQADIADAEAMRRVVRNQEVVFHLCGRPGAVRSVDAPLADLRTNLEGTVSLLEAMRVVAPEAKLVFAGSRLAYGVPRALPVDEEHPMVPRCPHGIHQAAIDRYLAVYGELHGVRSTRLRITNVYGPGQVRGRNSYGVLNYFVQETVAGRPIVIYGDGVILRDYVFIDDVRRALLLAGVVAASDGLAMNVGGGEGTAIVDAARTIVRLAGAGGIESVEWPAAARAVETGSFVANVERIQRVLGWSSGVPLEDGLRRTIDAYR
jgi:UDP-glucose 4-epimerase